jgi:hydrogenase-4 membrane subunit HyfE
VDGTITSTPSHTFNVRLDFQQTGGLAVHIVFLVLSNQLFNAAITMIMSVLMLITRSMLLVLFLSPYRKSSHKYPLSADQARDRLTMLN